MTFCGRNRGTFYFSRTKRSVKKEKTGVREFFIHRSTLLYRLEKIKEILESDLSSPDEILYLMLSFRFIDLENEEENRSGSSQPEKHR